MYSIRTKILGIVLFFIISIGIAFFIYSRLTTVNYKRLSLESIEKTVNFETEKVNKIIAEIERAAIFYSIGGNLCYRAQSEDLGEKLAAEFLESFPFAVGGGFWFEPYAFKKDQLRAGFYAFYDKTAEKVRLDDTFTMDEYDYHNTGWYREIAGNVTQPYQVVWTMPYVDDSGTFSLMTTAGSGIFDEDGKLIVMSTVDWKIQGVVKELTNINPTEKSFVLLCVPEKDYIISCTQTRSIPGASIGTIPWDINAASFEFNNIKYLSFARCMDNGWFLSVQIPEEEIFAKIEEQNSRFSVLMALVSVVVLLFAYLLISKLINAPIKQLTSDVSQLDLGNLDMQIKVSSKDELGHFARVFNKMKSELKNSIEETVRERSEKERISTEIEVAAEIQASMLPCIFPPFPERKEFDLYASMVPAKEIGGDFYDFYFIDKDNLAVVIADVSGKGVPAALFMVIAKTLIKNCSSCRTLKAVFESVNKKLCEGNETGMFVTAFMGIYNIPTGNFKYVNAGHNPPFVKKHGKFQFLKTDPCLILAWMKDAKYTEDEIFLEPGDILYLYTDGVTEAMNIDNTMFGEERLLTALDKNKDSSPRELLFSIKQELNNFAGEAEHTDDVTMLALKVAILPEAPFAVSVATKHLTLEARVENLDNVMDFINAGLAAVNYPSRVQNEINTAAEEIFINIANYAYAPATGDVTISVSVSIDGKTRICFEDAGKTFNPLEQPSPDLDKPIVDREIGGLGIFLVKKLMDSVEYSRIEGKNILVMTKNHQ